MPKPISDADPTPIRVAIVTMDSHMAGAIDAARALLEPAMPGLVLELHSADEWGGSKAALDACHQAIGDADIVIATMLFLDEHIRKVLPALQARRDQCDALLCAMSATEVVKLTRLGRFSMSGESKGALGFLKKLKPKKTAKAGHGEAQMRMLRNLPRLLRFVPGTAQDLRVYFLALQYWLAGSAENLASLVSLLVSRYAVGARAGLREATPAAPPTEYPEIGLYHPKTGIVTDAAALPKPGRCLGTVGLLLMRGYILAGDTGHYDGVIAAFEKQNLQVVPAFATGLDARPAMERYFLAEGSTCVDAVVSLTGFSLVGGPAYNDAKAAEALLGRLNVPYVVAYPLEFQTIEGWRDDPRGLTPIEATMMVALPEIDGAILPMAYGGRSTAGAIDQHRKMVVHPERAAMLADRVARIVALRRTPRAERRLAIVIFNFPPNAGSTGTAAYLSVFASLFNTLAGLQAAGYRVDLPADADALRIAITIGNAARYGAQANVAAKIPLADHIRREPHLAEIEAVWGPAPGRHLTDGSTLFVLGAMFGEVFVGVQPAFGYEGDPMRLLFERGFAPTHAFSAFYRWIAEDFGANAVLHFGTHGALEFMPGKQAGLSGACWPDRLIGALPNYYLYASNNPSEGILAKRRANATLISHLTPSLIAAGLYKGLADLKSSLARWRALAEDDDRAALAALIQAEAAALDLAPASPAWDEADAAIARLGNALLELEYTLIPHGLHVVGVPPTEAERCETLDAAGITEPAERARLDALLAEDFEIPGLIAALDGGYVRPAPGGDVLRNPEVLPTGRNLYGFDPFRMPSAFAVEDGGRQAETLLAHHAAAGHRLPETVALVLWGSDNLKSEGAPIAQALRLMGAAPRRDSYGRLAGAELIPLAELGRPRIDVVITLSGIFRDLLPLQTKMLAEAALLAASAEEPEAQNFIRRHVLAYLAEHGGTIEDAASRIFSNAEGAYGANVNQLVEASAWGDEDELGKAFIARKGFAYGTSGKAVRQDKVLGSLLASVDIAYQNLESLELGVTSVDHYFDGLGGMSRAVKHARGESASLYIGDQTRGTAKVRTLSEQLSLETRTRMLNPKYYEALLAHGHEGVRQIEAQVTNTLGWSATTGEVEPWVYRRITETFVLDAEMRARLAALNPTASAKIAGRLIEAQERQYWSPDPAMLEALREAGEELEDRLEGIEMGVAA